MQCHLCGKESTLFSSVIENVEMQVCSNCQKFGTIPRSLEVKKPKGLDLGEEYVVDNYNEVIKAARERKGLKMQDAAKKLAFKESLLMKFENGSLIPNILEAKKLERFYGIRLVEDDSSTEFSKSAKSSVFTLADTINQQS